MNNKCNVCNNYLRGLDRCKYCSFELADDLPWTDDDRWDILDLDDDMEWSHLQIQYRLFAKGIECLSADIWWDNNLAIIIGVNATADRVADALKVYRQAVYDLSDKGLMIINLFEEKYLRGELKDE